MKEAKKYLQRNFILSDDGLLLCDLEAHMEYTKLVQLESLLDFVENNNPDSIGLINSLKYEIDSILRNEDNLEEPEDSGSLNY